MACVNDTVIFGAIGTNTDQVTWSAPGADPDSGSGPEFTAKWDSPGQQTVTASCNGSTQSATVTVIKVEITDENGNILTGNQQTVVGKKIALKGKVTPDTLPIDKRIWSISGSVVKGYTQTQATGQAQPLQATDLSGDSATFYWIAGVDSANVTYSITSGN